MAFKFDVVVSGISGRFPECDDIDTFKKKLYTGDSSQFITSNEKKWTREFKLNRYGDKAAVPDATGKYTQETEFDYRLFKFNQLFGRSTDVINRKCLEPAFEAIVDAGINPYSLDGANIGVYMSGATSEREILYFMENILHHVFVLGNARTMAPNRLSYALNLTGPSHAFHTTPIGGLEALATAKEQISDGTIEAAIVMVGSNIADPAFSYSYMHLNFLSTDGNCRSFDKNANGFVRSECTIALFLQREQDAKRQYGKLVLCDTIFEGLSSHTLLGYDEEYLKKSLSQIYERNADASLAEEVAFVELTGSAVKKFESVEVNAVAEILCKQRTTSLLVGSAMSNVGLTEATTGFLSILKTLLILDSQIIPPNSNFSEVNDEICAFREKKMKVVDKKTELCGSVVAVNTVGLWGVVSHAVLQNNTKKRTNNADTIPRLLLLSGRTADGLRKVLKKVEFDAFNAEAIALANEVFYQNMPFNIYRAFTILPKIENVAAVIDECGHSRRPICFIFSGMGSQWNGMGKQLLDFPIIAEIIKRCDAVLRPKSIDIYKVLLSEDSTIFDDITMSFVAIICMQIALTEVLKKLNIVPDLILGHSVGEIGCSYADGCLTLEQAVLSSYARGMVSTSTKTIKGMMAAVGKGYKEIRNDVPKGIEIACHNAENSCTLSGPAEDVDAYVMKLKNQGIFAKSVNVANIAYHSQYIRPAAPKLLEQLKKIIPEPKRRSSKWISSSVPESEWQSPSAYQCSAEYLTNNLLKPVLFEEASRHIPKDAICIEIAPHGLLQAILKRSLPVTCSNISLTLRSTKKENLNYLLSSIGKLYVAGCEPAINNLYPSIEFPVSRGTPSISSYCTWFHGDVDDIRPPYFSPKAFPLSNEDIVVQINENAEFNFLKHHRIHKSTVIPPSFFLYLVWRILLVQKNIKMDALPVVFEKVKVHKHVKIVVSTPQVVNIMIQGTGSFEVLCRAKSSRHDNVIMTGKVEFIHDTVTIPSISFDSVQSKFVLNADDINTIFKNVGFHLGECFQLLNSYKIKDSVPLEFHGEFEWREDWVTFLDSIMRFHMFPDLSKSKLCFLHSIRRMVIIPSVMNSQKSGFKVDANYSPVTKCFRCSGIEIYDVKWKTKNQQTTSASSLKIKKMKFISYNNPSCLSPAEFVDLCIQISMESSEIANILDSKFFICDYTKKFIESIQGSEMIDSNNERVVVCDDKTLASKKLSRHDSYLMITEDDMPDVDLSNLQDVYILLIVSQYNSNTIFNDFATILKQNFTGKMFILLKKKLGNSYAIREEYDNTKVSNLSSSIDSFNGKKEIIIRSDLDSSSLEIMFSKKNRRNIRYIFGTDSNRLVAKRNPELKHELFPELPTLVMKNRDWGSYRYMSSYSIENNYTSKLKDCLNNIKMESVQVEFVRPNLTALSQDTQKQSFGIEFSGVNATGKKLMGLTMVDRNEPVLKLDPYLTWWIPENWALEDATSVPLIYAHAFTILKSFENSIYMPNLTILINAGEDMLDIEICASLCLAKKYTVYIVVSKTEQINHLRRNCPMLAESHIMLNDNGRFGYEIMKKTKGEGVSVIINYVAGIDSFTDTVNYASLFSFYIETVQHNLHENNEIGMLPFRNSLCFTPVLKSIPYLLKQPEDIKEYLQRAMNEGIETGLVCPINESSMMETNRNIDSIMTVTSESRLQTTTSIEVAREDFRFKPNHSYIILEKECRKEAWMNLIHWLKDRGAVNFLVLVEEFPVHHKISQLNCLTSQNINVSFKPLNQLTSIEDAAKLIQETNKIAPVDSIFFMSLDSCSQKVHFMDMASQHNGRNIKFISLFSDGLEEMELRQRKGLPTFVLHGENFPKNISDVMTEFEKILSNYNLDNNGDVLYHVIDERKTPNFEKKYCFLKNYLPKDINSLERIGHHLSDRTEFVEMISRSPKLADCRAVLPIFIIPSLHACELKSLFHSLIYPVFCASFSENCSSVRNTAEMLFQHLKHIQPIGPITLIGETWNASVAVELSALIKQSGRDFRLFLLQGNPVEWKETIKSLNLTNTPDFENILLQIYGEKLKKYLFSCDQMKTSKNESTISQEDSVILVHRCLNVLKSQFNNICNYEANTANLENAILFSTEDSQSIISQSVLSNTCHIICIQEDDYEKFIRSPVIVKKINKQALFSWDL